MFVQREYIGSCLNLVCAVLDLVLSGSPVVFVHTEYIGSCLNLVCAVVDLVLSRSPFVFVQREYIGSCLENFSLVKCNYHIIAFVHMKIRDSEVHYGSIEDEIIFTYNFHMWSLFFLTNVIFHSCELAYCV